MFSSTNVGIHDVKDVSVRYEEAGPEGRTKYARVHFHTAYGVVEVVAYVQGRDNLGVLNAALVEQEIKDEERKQATAAALKAVEAPL